MDLLHTWSLGIRTKSRSTAYPKVWLQVYTRVYYVVGVCYQLFTWHTEQGAVYEESQTHASGEHPYTTKVRNLPNSVTERDAKGISTAVSEPTQPPGN